MRKKSISPLQGQKKTVQIHAIDLDANGIGRLPEDDPNSPGKIVFINGAMIGEKISYTITQDKSRFQKGKINSIASESFARIKPRCEWYGNCGGCTMQHIDSRTQIAIKQRALEDNLRFIGRVTPQVIMRPIVSSDWGYRHRTRLSVVNRSIKKGTVLVGFHEPQNRYVSDMTSCEILPEEWSHLLMPLREFVMALSIRDRIPQIELSRGDPSSIRNSVMVIRHLLPFTIQDESLIKQFADEHNLWIWTQAQGVETTKPFYPLEGELFYTIPEFDLKLHYHPTDFTQVNHAMNQVMVSKAIRLLEIESQERVLDLFCGIGNFTLAIAKKASQVLGIEGSHELFERAKNNASLNKVDHNTQWLQANLFDVTTAIIQSWGIASKWLIDPPRDGAFTLVNALAALASSQDQGDQLFLPKRIVYVSCNPATLARDAEVLVHQAGYQLLQAGIMNMFPHTSHVESIAVFEKA